MAAEFVDALKGYEYFLKVRGKASIEIVNDFLLHNGRTPISSRTYSHYIKLLRNGFRSYIPINKFDVFQSLGRLQMAADRRRYRRETSSLKIQVSKNGKTWIDGRLLDKSIVGFGIEINDKFPSTPGNQLWVRIQAYKDIPTTLVWRNHSEASTRIGLRAYEFIAKYQYSDDEADLQRLRGLLKISRFIDGDIDWNEIYRILEKTDELIGALSSLMYTLDELIKSDVKLANPILSSIKFGSAGDAQIKIDFGIAEILKLIIEKIQFGRLEKQRYRTENRKLELEAENLEIETIRNAVNLRRELQEPEFADQIVSELPEIVKRVFKIKELPEGILDEGSPERAILNGRVIPAATELVAGDDTDFDIKVSVDEINK